MVIIIFILDLLKLININKYSVPMIYVNIICYIWLKFWLAERIIIGILSVIYCIPWLIQNYLCFLNLKYIFFLLNKVFK